MYRRGFIASLASLAAPRASAAAPSVEVESPDLDALDLVLEGDRRLARRTLVLSPTGEAPPRSLPVLVLLHGLGETTHELLGVAAWAKRYGLVSAWHRLAHPPVAATTPRARYLTAEHAEAINRALGAEPFAAPVVVCPVTPNPRKHASPKAALDAYADWVVGPLLSEVARAVPAADVTRVGLDGCSLGGYVALEVFLRRAHRFATLGTVQAAYGAHRARGYAEAVAEALAGRGAIPLHVETSSLDPYRKANEAFARELGRRGLDVDLVVLPGPHDQSWLREVGSLEMLRWHAAALRRASAPAPPPRAATRRPDTDPAPDAAHPAPRKAH